MNQRSEIGISNAEAESDYLPFKDAPMNITIFCSRIEQSSNRVGTGHFTLGDKLKTVVEALHKDGELSGAIKNSRGYWYYDLSDQKVIFAKLCSQNRAGKVFYGARTKKKLENYCTYCGY